MGSILTSVKKMLGITEEYEHFDADIIMHINTVFFTLTQLGVGPPEGFLIEDKESVWSDFVSGTVESEAVKSYVYLKVKLLFDSASLTSPVIEAMNRSIAELEWRFNVAVDSKATET